MENYILNEVLYDENSNFEEALSGVRNNAYSYNSEYNFLYDENSRVKVFNALEQMKFESLDQLFYDEQIDYEVFSKLNQYSIFKILKKYPVGVRCKFFMKYKDWYALNFHQYDLLAASSSKTIPLTISSSSFSQSCVDDNTFSKLMKGTEEGRKFLSAHPCDKVLIDSERRELCKLICGLLLNDDITLGRKECGIIAKSIPNLYLKENSKCYFDNNKGFLYNKSINMKTSLREQGLIEMPEKKKLKLETKETEISYSREICISDDFIKNNPFDTGDRFLFHWENSAQKRIADIRMDQMRNISNIIQTYKTFGRSDGYYYLMLDFNYSHPDINFDEKWNKLKQDLLIVLPRNITNGRIKNKFTTIHKMSSTAQTMAIILGLHGQLYSRGSVKKETKDKVSRDTIEDGFSQMITIIKSESLVTMHLADMKETAVARKQTIQPFIICFGSDIENTSENILVVFDEYKYKFSDINLAIEVLLKMFIVFNLKYPVTCKNVYEFLSNTLLNQNVTLSSKGQSLLNLIENSDQL